MKTLHYKYSNTLTACNLQLKGVKVAKSWLKVTCRDCLKTVPSYARR